MDKCQHNQKITKFCVTESCTWKQAGGCNNCIKKYHNHIGTTHFTQEKDLQNLLRKYKTETHVKPRVKLLQESIHNYFSSIKLEIITFIDDLDRKMRADICYPLLTKNGFLNLYKKLKKKEYRKLNQKQFRLFYQKTNKCNIEQINNDQKNMYQTFIKKYSEIFKQISKDFNGIMKLIKDHDYLRDSKDGKGLQIYKQEDNQKINQLFNVIDNQINKTTPEIQINLINQNNLQLRQENVSILVKNNNHTQNNEIKQKQIVKYNQLIRNQSKNRKLSQNSQISKDSKSQTAKSQSGQKDQQLSQMKKRLVGLMGNQSKIKSNVQNMQSYSTKSAFQNKIAQIQNKRKQSINIDPTIRLDQPPILRTNNYYLQVPGSSTNSNNQKNFQLRRTSTDQASKIINQINYSELSINMSENISKGIVLKQQFQVNHSQLPSMNTANISNDSKKHPSINNKFRAIVVPMKGQFKIEEANQQHSPILKRKKEVNKSDFLVVNQVPKQIIPAQSQITIVLSQNQNKSIALLNQSLKKNATQAIKLLQKSLEYAPNNLSAAQYLSYLLLQTNQPYQCHKVCNKILELLQGQILYDINTLHIHNNKAASLIQLGRYSESIPLLQKCLQIKQVDLFYKNLGDAYFSIGIYEKSIYNYEKCISLNEDNSQAYYNMAVCLYTQQNYYKGLRMIQKAIRLNGKRQDYQQLATNIRQRL